MPASEIHKLPVRLLMPHNAGFLLPVDSINNCLQLDVNPGYPPKLCAIFSALIPGLEGSRKVRMFPVGTLEDVLIRIEESGWKIKVSFMRGAENVQEEADALSGIWRPVRLYLYLYKRIEFTGKFDEAGKVALNGFMRAFENASRNEREGHGPPSLPIQLNAPEDQAARHIESSKAANAESIPGSVTAPTPNIKLEPGSQNVSNDLLRSISRSPPWVPPSTFDHLPSPSSLNPASLPLPAFITLSSLDIVTFEYVLPLVLSPLGGSFPLSVVLFPSARELVFFLPPNQRISVPISVNSGFTWRIGNNPGQLYFCIPVCKIVAMQGIKKEGSLNSEKFWHDFDWCDIAQDSGQLGKILACKMGAYLAATVWGRDKKLEAEKLGAHIDASKWG